MKVCFLLDENLPPHLKTALQRFDPVIDILRVGDEGAPALGTLDPDILHYLEDARRFLVTDNRRSMFTHLDVYWANGGHVWGVCWIRPEASLRQVVEDLYMIWIASEAEEWIDHLEWLPFQG